MAIAVRSGAGLVREGRSDHRVAPGDVVVETETPRGVRTDDGVRLEALLVTAPPAIDVEHEPVREGLRRGEFDPRREDR